MDSPATTQNAAPPVEGAIRNPANPNHFMVLKPVDGRVRVFAGKKLIADTIDAVCVIEIGRKAYDPVVYVPSEDIAAQLQRTEKTSHCPLKGEAGYYAIDGEEIGWSYVQPFEFADQLAGRHAFWASKVRIELGG